MRRYGSGYGYDYMRLHIFFRCSCCSIVAGLTLAAGAQVPAHAGRRKSRRRLRGHSRRRQTRLSWCLRKDRSRAALPSASVAAVAAGMAGAAPGHTAEAGRRFASTRPAGHTMRDKRWWRENGCLSGLGKLFAFVASLLLAAQACDDAQPCGARHCTVQGGARGRWEALLSTSEHGLGRLRGGSGRQASRMPDDNNVAGAGREYLLERMRQVRRVSAGAQRGNVSGRAPSQSDFSLDVDARRKRRGWAGWAAGTTRRFCPSRSRPATMQATVTRTTTLSHQATATPNKTAGVGARRRAAASSRSPGGKGTHLRG